MTLRHSSGMSFVEVLFALGLAATTTAVALPSVSSALAHLQTAAAVRYMAGRLQHVRVDAASRASDTAVRFQAAGGTYEFAVFVDGNRNGVRSADIEQGVDRQVTAFERLSDHFPGVAFGALPGLPAVDPGGTAPGDDPIRFGVSDSLTFTPIGTSTPGSLYIQGQSRTQYAIRVLGETGRARIFQFDANRRQWRGL